MDRNEFIKRMEAGETVYVLSVDSRSAMYEPRDFTGSSVANLEDDEALVAFGGNSIRYESADSLDAATEEIARKRVSKSEELAQYSDVIFYDWPNWTEHMRWVASAKTYTADIVDWAEAAETVGE